MAETAADIAFKNILQAKPSAFEYLLNRVGDLSASERELIEYKRGSSEPGDLPAIWGKAVCAFANTGGGLLIWGLDARKNQPIKYDPVQNVFELERRLKELQPAVTQPLVSGIEIRAIPEPQKDSGFVVCKIEESRWKPHQDTNSSHFYIRSGDNAKPAPFAIVQALFNSRREARLEFSGRVTTANRNAEPHVEFQCWIKNKGPVSAYDIVAVYQHDVQRIGRAFQPDSTFWKHEFSGGDRQLAFAKLCIHPEQALSFITSPLGLATSFQTMIKHGPYDIKLKLMARDQRPLYWRLTLDSETLPLNLGESRSIESSEWDGKS